MMSLWTLGAKPRPHDAERIADALLNSVVGGPSTGSGSERVAPTRKRARFHTLAVQEVRPLTQDAVEVTFAVPAALSGEFDYLAGQHVALRAEIDGREVRRSYSLCRPPAAGSVSVAIKRDHGGQFSTWAQTELRPGDEIDVMSPQGGFTSTLAALDGAHVAGIAAGSGITPLMALAATVLSRSETSEFTLVYTNRSTMDVMFLEELADLKDRYPARFAVHHVLTREQRSAPLLSGRIDEERLRGILDGLVLPGTVDEWFLCGPFDLVQLCRDTLADIGVEPAHVRYELFTTGEPGQERPDAGRPVVVREDEPVTVIEFTLDGQSGMVQSPVSANESILNAALRVRPDVPFACAGGVCGTCRARLVDGSVTMTENYALEKDEIERGYVLTCQSHPTSDRVVVDYDV
ncbi:1,2-phenylacetyl-CoA epoxidase subunit PaaE [Microbacterium capsulatum]|uniref:1,2-phenylacetyl-CoA epoxidase subunit PaaE n=1 Tax=Microbacterium capsulatum TaxID=3041921 RepID=A0ABU0XEY1_9MICO|nr:1,2-phenylacetyl-CoA epoxidase subunit PaaE [Microbacterium sp. ASV81]MDQ4213621.1 1,2-phenylacetyl-CoA epoxidase subunit PaaE [Microbacterium sp. ASV81]